MRVRRRPEGFTLRVLRRTRLLGARTPRIHDDRWIQAEYLIDPDSLLISRISRRIQGAPFGDTTQTMTFAELGSVTEIVTPTAVCQR